MSVTFTYTFPYQSWKSFCGQPFCSLTLGLELAGLAQSNSILATSPSGLQEFLHLSFFFLFFSWPILVFFCQPHWGPQILQMGRKPICLLCYFLLGGWVVFEPFLGRIGTLSLLALGLAGQVLCDRLADMCAVQVDKVILTSSGRGPSSKVPSTSETPLCSQPSGKALSPWTLPYTTWGKKHNESLCSVFLFSQDAGGDGCHLSGALVATLQSPRTFLSLPPSPSLLMSSVLGLQTEISCYRKTRSNVLGGKSVGD